MKLFIVSGISGSGKSIALNALEDIGCYCIDNLPLGLLPAFAEQVAHGQYEMAAVGIDARNLSADLSSELPSREQLQRLGIDCTTIFLDADDATLFKRFSETRRRHPLTADTLPLDEAIAQERQLLKPIAARADIRIDTTRTNVHQLRDRIRSQLGMEGDETMSILLQSFGFKHGIPIGADFVFDVRCLPNPHWEPNLRKFTGQEQPVIEFLQGQAEVEEMFTDISQFLQRWLPRFEKDRRNYMTIAVGCTGGYHRSVYFVERLARHFQQTYNNVITRHRELA